MHTDTQSRPWSDPLTAGPAADENTRPLVDYTVLNDRTASSRRIRAAHQVYEHLIGLWAPAVIESSHELGVFDELVGTGRTSGEVAKARDMDERATRVLLDALFSYGLVERAEDVDGAYRYLLTDEYAEVLLPGGPFSLVGKIRHDQNVAWPSWQRLAETVRSGTRDQLNGISETNYQDLVGGINFWAPPIVEILGDSLLDMGWMVGEQVSVLDVGCGTGLYAQLLLQRFPQWRACGLDAPKIIPLAEEQAASLGVADRFDGQVVDIWTDSWGHGADLLLLSNMIHLQTAESAGPLLRRAAAALKPGGLLCIADQVTVPGEDDSAQNRFAMLFAASMLATGGGDAYSVDICDEWLHEAGLRRVALLDAPMHRLILAEHAG